MKRIFFSTALLAGGLIVCPVGARAQQQPVQPQRPVQPDVAAPGVESSSKQAKSRASHADDFLVHGTVFTAEGMALPGAELHIRSAQEKKFKWNDAANSRGEFAIRVKMGGAYEVVGRAKGYQEQTQPVNAATGERFKDLVFRMQRQTGKKS